MARATKMRSADKDDPIYKGGFVISSKKRAAAAKEVSTKKQGSGDRVQVNEKGSGE